MAVSNAKWNQFVAQRDGKLGAPGIARKQLDADEVDERNAQTLAHRIDAGVAPSRNAARIGFSPPRSPR